MLSAFPKPRLMLKMNDRANKKTYAVNAKQASLFILFFGLLFNKQVRLLFNLHTTGFSWNNLNLNPNLLSKGIPKGFAPLLMYIFPGDGKGSQGLGYLQDFLVRTGEGTFIILNFNFFKKLIIA